MKTFVCNSWILRKHCFILLFLILKIFQEAKPVYKKRQFCELFKNAVLKREFFSIHFESPSEKIFPGLYIFNIYDFFFRIWHGKKIQNFNLASCWAIQKLYKYHIFDMFQHRWWRFVTSLKKTVFCYPWFLWE